MASQVHGMHLIKGYAQEGSYPSSIDYGNIAANKKQGQEKEKRI
jgi:hypothetical protein